MFVIFDLDGTLSDDRHRRHLVRGRPYADHAAYHAACVDDVPNWPVIKVCQAHVAAGHRVEIWTGRAEEVRSRTLVQLNEWGLRAISSRSPLLKMRPEGDRTPVVELKRQWLREASAAGAIPDLVYDDREDCAEMFRSRGVACFLVEMPEPPRSEATLPDFDFGAVRSGHPARKPSEV